MPTIEPAAPPVSLNLAVCGPSAPVLEVIVPLHWPRYACGTEPVPVPVLDEGGLDEAVLAGTEMDGVSVAAGDAVTADETVTVAELDDSRLAEGLPPEPCSAVNAITAPAVTHPFLKRPFMAAFTPPWWLLAAELSQPA